MDAKPAPPLASYTDAELWKLVSVAGFESDRAEARAELVRRGRCA